MGRRLLDAAEQVTALAALANWQLREGRLHRTLQFPDFRTAFAFLTQVAAEAERLGHHPDWRQAYGRVEIALTTHDLGGLSALDVALAQAIDALLDQAGAGA